MNLFPKAMLAAYKCHGDTRSGQALHHCHDYLYRLDFAGSNESVPMSLWDYLCDDPHHETPGSGWALPDKTFDLFLQGTTGDVLYVGGGSGRFHRRIASWRRGCHSIDISDEAIELMRLRGVPCELMDGRDMDFKDDSYPLVVIGNDVMDCHEDPEPFITEAARVASEGIVFNGYLALGQTDPSFAFEFEMIYAGEKEVATGYAQHYAPLIALAERIGMTWVQTRFYLADVEKPELSWIVQMRW